MGNLLKEYVKIKHFDSEKLISNLRILQLLARLAEVQVRVQTGFDTESLLKNCTLNKRQLQRLALTGHVSRVRLHVNARAVTKFIQRFFGRSEH